MRALTHVFPVVLLLAAACSRPTPPPTPPPVPVAAATAAPVEVASRDAWHAFGNEPFWSVEARGTTLVFSTPEDLVGVTLQGKQVPSPAGTLTTGQGERGGFQLAITPGQCSDGMSDRTHAYAATFTYAGQAYTGCAEARE